MKGDVKSRGVKLFIMGRGFVEKRGALLKGGLRPLTTNEGFRILHGKSFSSLFSKSWNCTGTIFYCKIKVYMLNVKIFDYSWIVLYHEQIPSFRHTIICKMMPTSKIYSTLAVKRDKLTKFIRAPLKIKKILKMCISNYIALTIY